MRCTLRHFRKAHKTENPRCIRMLRGFATIRRAMDRCALQQVGGVWSDASPVRVFKRRTKKSGGIANDSAGSVYSARSDSAAA
jgi:hypothetical protein